MRTAARTCTIVVIAALALMTAAPASAQGSSPKPPELVAAGTGRTDGSCFVEVHTSSAWPPRSAVGPWVLSITVQASGGAIDIRTFPSDDESSSTTRATGPTGRTPITVTAVNEEVTAYAWTCDKAPATLEVRFEVNDDTGHTLLADAMVSHPFDGADRAPGKVPAGDLVKDETGDLLSPEQGGGEDPAEQLPSKSSGGGTTGAMAMALLVLGICGMGYWLWQSRGGEDDPDF